MADSQRARLKDRHAELEARIAGEMKRPAPDTGLVALLKKTKLRIKQQLAAPPR